MIRCIQSFNVNKDNTIFCFANNREVVQVEKRAHIYEKFTRQKARLFLSDCIHTVYQDENKKWLMCKFKPNNEAETLVAEGGEMIRLNPSLTKSAARIEGKHFRILDINNFNNENFYEFWKIVPNEVNFVKL